MSLYYLLVCALFISSVSTRCPLWTQCNEASKSNNEWRLASYNYDKYLAFSAMEARLHLLEKTYPELVSLTIVGQSAENRNLYLVTISSKLNGDQEGSQETTNGDIPERETVQKDSKEGLERDDREDRESAMNFRANFDFNKIFRHKVRQRTDSVIRQKPVIFVDGGIHAREWASPLAALYIIDQIIKDPSLTGPIEWRIMPMVNPDGYIFSSNSRGDRFWRKNRSYTWDADCWGVDLNRNFDVDWKETERDPCISDYGGTSAFSEPESRALRDSINEVKDVIKAYVTIHSYGQYILYPYGYSDTHQPDNLAELDQMAHGMAQEIFDVYGTNYRVGSSSILGTAPGGSDDWAHMKAKVPYTILIEMKPQPGIGLRGFHLPPTELQQAVDEVWRATSYLARNIKL